MTKEQGDEDQDQKDKDRNLQDQNQRNKVKKGGLGAFASTRQQQML
jgi:hypothetical protein